MAVRDVRLGFACNGLSAASSIAGVNTLRLVFEPNPVPDMIAVGLTPSNDGYSRTGGIGGTGLFVIASTNIGAPATLTARVRLLDPSLPLTAVICETDSSTGACKATPSATVTRSVAQNENTTWTVFLTATGDVLQDPARYRVVFEFLDGAGVSRGSTTTAVTSH